MRVASSSTDRACRRTQSPWVMGTGGRWCDGPTGIEDFEEFVESSEATAYARTSTTERVELILERAG